MSECPHDNDGCPGPESGPQGAHCYRCRPEYHKRLYGDHWDAVAGGRYTPR